jgi:glycosyltransferase involved in cell wall biosynthesis
VTLASDSAAVTIVVPGYQVARYAGEALDSLRAQTRGDWVAILVDDGSTGGTAEIFADAAAADPRFRLAHHGHQRGLGAARNTGLDLAETPYVGFLDGDDAFTPTALERLVGVLDETGSDFALGAYVRLRPEPGGGYSTGMVQPWVAAATDPERRGITIDEHPAASANIVAWSKVSRTDFWRRTGLRFPVDRLYEDQVVAQRMYASARAFDVVPDVVTLWRERADGSSITQRKASIDVLRDYLDGMSGGIAELEAGGHSAAVLERVRLILGMDLPPLVRIALDHHDDAYGRAIGAFTRDVWARGGASVVLDDEAGALVAAARGW